MKKKLLHIMMGTYNPDLQKGLDSVFNCVHLDWLPFGENSPMLQHEILLKVQSFNPDIVFMHTQSGNAVTLETLREIKNTSSALIYNWSGDVRHPLPQHYINTGREIDLTLFTNVDDVETCLANGVKADFLQVGYDSNHFNIFGSVDNSKYPEIVFLGSNYTTNPFPLTNLRYEVVNRLKQEFGSRFGVYGGNWGGIESGNITSYEEEGKLYRSCKIAVNLSHFAYKRYSSDRMFRILGSGAFCLSHWFPEIEKDFKVGEDIVVWENIDDLVNKIKYYLNNNYERESIAIRGHFNAKTNFTWHHFAENLNKLI
jgi:glycosyltransferase involved in cell wall biosynthesis